MLDRFGLLNDFLKSAATSEDDDFDLPMYAPPKPAKAVPKPPPPILTPAAPAPPTPAPVVAPSPVAPVVPPRNPDLPSWFNPQAWTPIKKFKLEKEFPTSHWGKLDDEEQPKPEPFVSAPEPAPVTPEPQVELETEPEETPAMSPDEAKLYLKSLPEEEHIAETIVALQYADEELRGNYRNKKLISTTLALVIAHLKGLIDHADAVFKDKKDEGISAAQILIDHFEGEVKKLPVRYQERVSSELYKNIEGRKRGPLRELTSSWYGPELIFVNNRAIRLMKAGGQSVDEAEKMAKEEWSGLTELVEGLVPIYNDQDGYTRIELQKLGAQKLLGGGSFEDAKKLIVQHVEAIESGVITAENISMEDNNLEKLFPNVRVNPNEDWENDRAQDMSDEEMVREDLGDLPDDVINKLAPEIVQFGKQALKFAQLKDAIERGIDDDKMVEADDALQMIYDNIEVLARQIFVINPKYIAMPLAHEKFEDVYVVFKSVRSEAKEQGLESISDRTISPAESAMAGLHQDLGAPGIKEIDPRFKKNPRLQRPNEDIEQYRERQAHEKELADASRHRYLQRILANGDALGYLDRKRQYRLAQRPKETSEQYDERIKFEDEVDRIRKPEYKKNKWELVKWRKLAAMNPDNVQDLREQMMNLLKSQKTRTYELYQRIGNSWLSSDTLKEIEDSLMNARIQKFQHEYDTIKSLNGMNPLVLKAIEYLITQIPTYFDEAKNKFNRDKVSSARITLDMVSAFLKSANSAQAAL